MQLDLKPRNWEDRLTLFVGHLVNRKRQSSTVKSYISAIRNVLRDEGIQLNEDHFILSSLTKACRLINDQVRARLPLQRGMVGIIIKQVSRNFADQPYLETLYKALFATAYFGLFRVGELTTGTHPILARDVQIVKNKRKMLFILRTSKTHSKNVPPQMVKIAAVPRNVQLNRFQTGSLHFCPYQLLDNF